MVLVVQSDPTLIDGWCSALEAAGHEVIASRAFIEGIERLRDGGIDVVIVDSEGDVRRLLLGSGSDPKLPLIGNGIPMPAARPNTGDPTPVEVDDEPTSPRTKIPLPG